MCFAAFGAIIAHGIPLVSPRCAILFHAVRALFADSASGFLAQLTVPLPMRGGGVHLPKRLSKHAGRYLQVCALVRVF